MRDTTFAKELACADLGGKRIERILIKRTLSKAIRFSRWTGNQLRMSPLIVSENELLILIGDAVAENVFSRSFLEELHSILKSQLGDDGEVPTEEWLKDVSLSLSKERRVLDRLLRQRGAYPAGASQTLDPLIATFTATCASLARMKNELAETLYADRT